MRDISTIFRDEALQHRERERITCGDLLHISSRWTNWTYWFLMVVLVVGCAYVIFGKANEYATGIALIRDEARTVVRSPTGGSIARIFVQAGQRVEPHQMLVRFDDVRDRLDLDRLNRELESLQINRLTHPADPNAQQQLAAVRSQVDAAARRSRENTVSATRAGIVRDIRIHENQLVGPGELLLTIASESTALSVIAILPGRYRPLLTTGNQLRVEMNGFRYAYQQLVIDSVGNEVVGPNEIRRFLGPEVADSLLLQGPSIILTARLHSGAFKANGRTHPYYDGMQGTAQALVRSQRLLFWLIPGVKVISEGHDE